MDLHPLVEFSEGVAEVFLPGVRFHPSDAELLGYLGCYKANPNAFKAKGYFPIFEQHLPDIDPALIHEKCRLHPSHVACIFIGPKGDYRMKQKNLTYNAKQKDIQVLCEVDRVAGYVREVSKIDGPFKQQWSGWRVEELTLHHPPLPLQDIVIYRAIDTARLTSMAKPEYVINPVAGPFLGNVNIGEQGNVP